MATDRRKPQPSATHQRLAGERARSSSEGWRGGGSRGTEGGKSWLLVLILLLTAVKGDDVGKYRVGEDEYDIVVRYDRPARGSAEDLQNVTVFYEGENIPLLSFASVEFDTGLASINRIDGKRVVTVSGDVAAGFNGNAVLAAVQRGLKSRPAALVLELEEVEIAGSPHEGRECQGSAVGRPGRSALEAQW